MKFEMYKDKGGEFRFRLKASNGENILKSEGYVVRASCKNGIDSVKINSDKDRRYVRLTAKNGEPYFNLKASNGRIIGTSETYSSKQACENGIRSVMTNAPAAVVQDLT